MSLRRWTNDRLGRWAAGRTNRRTYRSRVLLIADHWDGSVQQFYHFMLGYLLPVAMWVEEHPGQAIALRDCGPMNVWLDLVGERVDVEVIPPGTALHMVVGDRMAHRILPGLDDPARFDREALRTGAAALRLLLGVPAPSVARSARIVIVDRSTSEDFYRGPESETHMSGRDRRSTPNLAALVACIPRSEVVDLARMAPREQIRLMEQSRVLIGQHGAGLLHMLWMPPGSSIVEIAPPLPPEVVTIFERLAECLGHRYARVPQATVHSPVDLDAVTDAVVTLSAR